ncbi:MAG TPA: glycerol-3-phosphate 1-O-acyltransferase PlsY [Thermoleophilia bacterium]|nr:glycerol-3-phosphate 1-O-acyltransferase PlsY [Thermoleophilia bacterium]
MLDVALAVALVIVGYLMGSIPFGVLIGRWFWGTDVRDFGSGNIGTTNVFRVLGAKAGILVLVFDMGKGFLPTFVAALLLRPWVAVIVGLVTLLGHTYSVFLRGNGGKGVATGAGVILALMPVVFLVLLLVWVVVVLTTRIVSLASILAAIAFCVATFVTDQPVSYRVAAVIATLVVVYAHRSNIRRIALRAENRIRLPWNDRGDAQPHGQ